MTNLLLMLAAPLFVFDNGTGRGVLTLHQQAELALRTGYAGIFYSGTKDIPELLAAHRQRGLQVLGIYTGMDLSKPNATFDPGLPEAIRQLKGSGALITFTINGKAPDADQQSVAVIRQVSDMAAASGLRVALYPHHGFHVARIEDALRIIGKADRKNLGLVFNLCHWLRSGDEPNLELRLKQALPHLFLVSINGADHSGDWDRLIQPLGRGEFNVKSFLNTLKSLGYQGPIGLQCYNVPGDREENLNLSMKAWSQF